MEQKEEEVEGRKGGREGGREGGRDSHVVALLQGPGTCVTQAHEGEGGREGGGDHRLSLGLGSLEDGRDVEGVA